MAKLNSLNYMGYRKLADSDAPVEGVTRVETKEGFAIKHQYRGDVGTTTNGGETKMKSKLTTWGN